jgi:deazaflavin-dependent oxidoreductase (nitroreductase family)
MADVFLYLTTTGRKSGLPRRIEIWFVESGGAHYVVSEMRRASGWVKNIERDPRVSFSVGTRGARESVLPNTPARARTVERVDEPDLVARVSALMDEKYGWSDGLIVELSPELSSD